MEQAPQLPPIPPEDEPLWARLRVDPKDRAAQEELVERYLPLVKAELGRLGANLPRHIDRQELYSEGVIGLLSAITHFETAQGVTFGAYARRRVWGAMMDRVRTLDGVPRSSRTATRKIARANNSFLNKHGRQPDETELASELGVGLDSLHELERQAGHSQTLSLDGAPGMSESAWSRSLAEQLPANRTLRDDPLTKMARDETKKQLVEGLETLPDRERAILVLYYHKGLMLKEIAAAMEVTESRVSQLQSRALLRLRAYLQRGHAIAEVSEEDEDAEAKEEVEAQTDDVAEDMVQETSQHIEEYRIFSDAGG